MVIDTSAGAPGRASPSWLSALVPLLLCWPVSTLGLGHDSDFDYCSLDTNHTMCRYRGVGPLCGRGSVGGPLTEAEKKTVLETHNRLRALVATGRERRGMPGPQPSATDMQYLEWDEELAAVAQRWADQCLFEHDSSRSVARFGVGQNLFQSEGGVPWDEAILSWYSEVQYFDRDLVDGFIPDAVTGHYTQLVWGNSRYVGCGKRTYSQKRLARRRRSDYERELRAYNETLHRYYDKYKSYLRNDPGYERQIRLYREYLEQALGVDGRETFDALVSKYETYRSINERFLHYDRKLKRKMATRIRPNPVISKSYGFSTERPVVAGLVFDYYVCNYGPSGNYPGARMYTRGANLCSYGLCSDPLVREYYPPLEVENDPLLSSIYS